jgi:hypothetical protein
LHIRALVSSHGDALREIKIDLAGSLARGYAMGITEDALASVLVSLPALQRATILAPFFDLVKFLHAIIGSYADASPWLQRTRTLTPSLEFLRLTLGSEEDTLKTALASGELSKLLLRRNLCKLSQLELRVVIGTRPEITNFVCSHLILRDNVKLYPELQNALLACMTRCRQQSDMLTGAVQQPAGREDWCGLSLVDIYDYSPFWDDTRDNWCVEDVARIMSYSRGEE